LGAVFKGLLTLHIVAGAHEMPVILQCLLYCAGINCFLLHKGVKQGDMQL
jgi:hypothetical protein